MKIVIEILAPLTGMPHKALAPSAHIPPGVHYTKRQTVGSRQLVVSLAADQSGKLLLMLCIAFSNAVLHSDRIDLLVVVTTAVNTMGLCTVGSGRQPWDFMRFMKTVAYFNDWRPDRLWADLAKRWSPADQVRECLSYP